MKHQLFMVRYFVNNRGIVNTIDEPFMYREDAELFLETAKEQIKGFLWGATLRYDPNEPDKRYKWKVV